MIPDILSEASKRKKQLSEEDLPRMKHDFMCIYGFIPTNVWNDEDIGLMRELWNFVIEEKNKREKFMINVMRGLGAKNEHIRDWQQG